MAQSGQVRPLAEDDLEQVVQLFDRAYLSGVGASSGGRYALFRHLFFDAPDRSDGGVASLVWEDQVGQVTGFCGAHPRWFVLDGHVIFAVAPGQLMVAPDLQGSGFGKTLVHAFFAGPQSFTFNSSAGDATRAITAAISAVNPPLRGIRCKSAHIRCSQALLRPMPTCGRADLAICKKSTPGPFEG